MGRFVKGEIVVVPFPFSDLTTVKQRPAFVVKDLDDRGIILCQITSKERKDNYSIRLTNRDFESGVLKKESYIKPNRLVTLDKALIRFRIGTLKSVKTKLIIDKIVDLITS